LSKPAANTEICSAAISLACEQGNDAQEYSFGLCLSKKGKEKAVL
jgi:hypothetical protein